VGRVGSFLAAAIILGTLGWLMFGLNWGIGALAYVVAAVVLSGAIGKLGPASKEESDPAD